MNDVTVLAASADTRRGLTIGLFLVFVAITLDITFWASRQNQDRRRLLRRRPVVLRPSRTAWRSAATTCPPPRSSASPG